MQFLNWLEAKRQKEQLDLGNKSIEELLQTADRLKTMCEKDEKTPQHMAHRKNIYKFGFHDEVLLYYAALIARNLAKIKQQGELNTSYLKHDNEVLLRYFSPEERATLGI